MKVRYYEGKQENFLEKLSFFSKDLVQPNKGKTDMMGAD